MIAILAIAVIATLLALGHITFREVALTWGVILGVLGAGLLLIFAFLYVCTDGFDVPVEGRQHSFDADGNVVTYYGYPPRDIAFAWVYIMGALIVVYIAGVIYGLYRALKSLFGSDPVVIPKTIPPVVGQVTVLRKER